MEHCTISIMVLPGMRTMQHVSTISTRFLLITRPRLHYLGSLLIPGKQCTDMLQRMQILLTLTIKNITCLDLQGKIMQIFLVATKNIEVDHYGRLEDHG